MVQIDTATEGKIVWVKINGEIDASSSIQLDECLQEQLGKEIPNIAVDCSSLNYISSAGLGVFMSYIEDLKANDQKMGLFGMNEKVFNVFKMLGLDQLMHILDSKKETTKLFDEE